MTHNGSSFFVPQDGSKTTPIKLTRADEIYLRNAFIMSFGAKLVDAAMRGDGIPDEFSDARDRNLRSAATRYRNRTESVLASVAEMTGISKEELQPFIQRAVVEGGRVRVNSRYAVEFNRTRAALITYPEH